MTEIEIRDRLRAALGEAEYPEGLGASLAAHLKGAGQRSPARPQTLIGAVLVLAVLAVVAFPRFARDYSAWTFSGRTVPVATPSPALASPSPTPTISPSPARLPAADLAAAGLADRPEAVTNFHQQATDSGYTVTLIGLYADSSHTIVFLHLEPDLGWPGGFSLADQQGALNSAGSGDRGAPGDYVYRNAAGPRPGTDGYADLTISVMAGPPYPLPKRLPGNWIFKARVQVQP